MIQIDLIPLFSIESKTSQNALQFIVLCARAFGALTETVNLRINLFFVFSFIGLVDVVFFLPLFMTLVHCVVLAIMGPALFLLSVRHTQL